MLPASSVSGDKYRFCPYDNTHVILAKSFDAHLIKCRVNHRGCKMTVCPLDHTHVVPKPELSHHLTQCDKRSLMDRDLQKRAGDDSLKGDVYGPPIVADHLAGKDTYESENWDEAPKRSGPTPALFNEQIKRTPKESYGINPGGGYLPPQADEPKIRKIPNHPAKAATFSNPSAAQIRPSRNQVFEFSVGNTGMTRMEGNPPRAPSAPLQAGAPGAPGGMTRVRTPDQGPRFIGRGVSKFATKSNPRPVASPPSPTPTPQIKSPPNADSQSKNFSPPPPRQFEDARTATRSPNKSRNSPQHQQQQHQQQNAWNRDSGDGSGVGPQGSFHNNTDASAASSLKNQQLLLQQGIILHQQQQLEQLKQQHSHQQLELAKKHQLQALQLQKLQEEEKKHMGQEQEKQEFELHAKTQILTQSIQEMNSSTSSPSQVDSVQNIMAATGLLEAIMAAGGNGLSGLLSSMSVQDSSNASVASSSSDQTGVKQERVGETWHEDNAAPANTNTQASSRLNVQDSKNNSNRGSPSDKQSSPLADLQKSKTTLQNRLREIEILEQKSMLGHMLSPQEESKMESRDEVEEQLAALLSGESKRV